MRKPEKYVVLLRHINKWYGMHRDEFKRGIFKEKNRLRDLKTTKLRQGGFLIPENRRDNMLTCILLFIVGLKLEMGTAYFVVLAIAAILCCVKFGMNIADKLSD